MREKQWKKKIILPIVAGLLISQLVTQTVWAAELPNAETVFENIDELETEPAGESFVGASEEEEAATEITEDILVEEILQPDKSVDMLDDYTLITYEDCRNIGKTGEWKIYTLNKDGQYVNKYGEPIEVNEGDGKWHMDIWMSPDCEEDLKYLLGLRSFLDKCDMDNLVVTLFWYPYPYMELTNEKLSKTLNQYGIPEDICVVNIWDPCPSSNETKGYGTTGNILATFLNSIAAGYGYAAASGNVIDAYRCPSAKNEFMVFFKNPEGELSDYSIGIPRTGLPGMSSSQCSFLIEDRLISIAVSIITLEKENFPYPSAYDVYPPAPKPTPTPVPVSVSPVQFKVAGVFGGRNVTFSSDTSDAAIYYSSTTSALTTQDACVRNGETVLFENFYGTIYARAYVNGVWGNVSRLILKIPVVNKPVITCKDGMVTIRTSTPDSYIYYTTDGSTPSLTNGTKMVKSSGSFMAPANCTVKAIAVRSCFTNSEIASAYVAGVKPGAPAFAVKGVIGGREVTFNSATAQGEIYYSYTTSRITTNDMHVKPGETVLFQNYYGTLYARTYVDGQWSNVSRLILRIPRVNTPTITALGDGRIRLSCSTPDSYIYYTTDGSLPSPANGKRLSASGGIVQISRGATVRAIAMRSCFTNSDCLNYYY